ncbi:MAG TPA: hypothetical protein VGP02_17950 [Mycobacteriales bacterium]|nr:hypothetical protein [Mycobacteriales bacterium]
MTANAQPATTDTEWEAVGPTGTRYEVSIRRSGFVEWMDDTVTTEGVVLSIASWLINWFVHLSVFWGRWTVFAGAVDSKERVKGRYRTRKAAAEAARGLVESIPTAGLPRRLS